MTEPKRIAVHGLPSMRPHGSIVGDKPDGYDPDRLVISFILDGEPVRYESGGMSSWGDMQTAPVRWDVVDLRAIGIDEDARAWVRGRCWYAHNWLLIMLETAEPEESAP